MPKLPPGAQEVLARVPWKPIFQRLPGTWLLLLLPFAIFGPVYLPASFGIYYFILHFLFLLNNCRSAYGMYVCYNNAKMYSVTDWLQKYCDDTGTVDGNDTRHDLPYEHVVHVIILPNYKEEMDTLCETLDVLASHTRAVSQYKVCLAMEETEQGCEEKAQTLMRMYAESFYEITYTVHPAGRPGEIRGKSSNVSWSASQMALRSGGYGARHEHEVLTVMDADTCFAEDYFSAVTYHYAVASPEQRKIMMFAPATVFDRNSKNVPVFVRVTDMFWSIGVISNLYPSSAVKIPCSAYSVSMDLAVSVNFWDAGPEAIGEDMHMYLKCFFATEGHVIVKSIFSPASQCNVEGTGVGLKGYINYLQARYTQAKRHLWGSLDTGYAIRRTILGLFAPNADTTEPTVALRNTSVTKSGKEERKTNYRLRVLAELMHRILESHILMGHLFTLIITSTLILPLRSSFSYALATYFWGILSDEPVHPYVEFALNVSFWVRMSIIVPNVIMIWYYEKYHQWVGFERWALAEKQPTQTYNRLQHQHKALDGKRVDSAKSLSEVANISGTTTSSGQPQELRSSDAFIISPAHAHLKVHYLGKRAQLSSPREYPRNLLDWFTIPVAGFLFYVMPQFHAQVSHLFTDSLDYKVAAKPQLSRPVLPTSSPAAAYHDQEVSIALPRDLPLASPPPPAYDAAVSGQAFNLNLGMHKARIGMGLGYESDVRSVASSKGDEGYFEEFVEEVPGSVERVGLITGRV
ncbi:hypothetical protein HK104_000972 [Borealophlyctis nickersoniae]|nr:hypothetical protein HK104_000972 [Borealophlyctis nickersoniae]